jgi:hypothetical protein
MNGVRTISRCSSLAKQDPGLTVAHCNNNDRLGFGICTNCMSLKCLELGPSNGKRCVREVS